VVANPEYVYSDAQQVVGSQKARPEFPLSQPSGIELGSSAFTRCAVAVRAQPVGVAWVLLVDGQRFSLTGEVRAIQLLGDVRRGARILG
jgi:hypothetical protein